MPVLVILIIFALAFYVYFKVKQVRSQRPIEKKWISGKSSICLGSFVLLFGINQVFLYPKETVTYVIAAIFLIVGLLSIIGGYKMYKYYLPLAIKEAEQLQK
ncbi:YtpI-like protein [Bacillus oleivorans]|uniref:YtpI-like protein n=1 Tax=Bacillus oleivorans TaxID=1448271 RepID=A0A285CV39_9BACI|nr:YtpI family protein [Bacillus oleivorans]SNX71422.1 YtpI-like protein [Bacillus oleivorans]